MDELLALDHGQVTARGRTVGTAAGMFTIAARTLRERGIEILMDEQPTAGWRRFDVRDPGGIRVELAGRTD